MEGIGVDGADGLSVKIAEHVAGFDGESLPETTLHAAKRALLDGIGVMLAASGVSPEVAPFVDHAAASGSGPARIFGSGVRTGAAMAAFANGAMAHALDFEDAFDAAPSHPDAALLPAVLAIADERGGVSGRELLTAIAIGCDLVCRMGLSLRREMEAGGWYPPPILGAFGAVAAAARLRRLDPRQVLDSFSLMLCQATCPGEIKYSRDTVIRAVREAFPAQAAVQSSAMAALGVRGFDEPLEGKAGFFRLYAEGQYDPAVLLDALGTRFWIEQLSFKRWPACRGTHAYIEAAQTLRARHGIAPGRIVEVVATGGEVQRMLVEPAARKVAPTTAIDAKFSIPFTVAARAGRHGGDARQLRRGLARRSRQACARGTRAVRAAPRLEPRACRLGGAGHHPRRWQHRRALGRHRRRPCLASDRRCWAGRQVRRLRDARTAPALAPGGGAAGRDHPVDRAGRRRVEGARAGLAMRHNENACSFAREC